MCHSGKQSAWGDIASLDVHRLHKTFQASPSSTQVSLAMDVLPGKEDKDMKMKQGQKSDEKLKDRLQKCTIETLFFRG